MVVIFKRLKVLKLCQGPNEGEEFQNAMLSSGILLKSSIRDKSLKVQNIVQALVFV